MKKLLQLIYFTDPLCSTCWAFEPHFRKIKLEYSHLLDVEYKMGGLLESWETYKDQNRKIRHPKDLAALWDDVGKKSGMSIDGNLWNENPIASSYPASLAFLAVKKLAPEKAEKYLRLIRELLFLKKIDISSIEIQTKIAKSIGIDTVLFDRELNSKNNLKQFYSDLKERKKYKIKLLPTFVLINQTGEYKILSSKDLYSKLELAIRNLCIDKVVKHKCNFSITTILKNYDFLATKEIAVLQNKPIYKVQSELDKMAVKGLVVEEKFKFAKFWRLKKEQTPMPNLKDKKFEISIIGAGIAGLSAAIFLKNKNINVKIFEKNNEQCQQGFGFLIMSNGFEMFRKMGLDSQIREKGNLIHKIKLLKKSGEIIRNSKINKCFAISRANCISILTDKVNKKNILYGKEPLTFYKNINNEINEIKFKDGSREHTDLIIASDGSHSKFRKLLFPNYKEHLIEEAEIVCVIKAPDLAKKLGHSFCKVNCYAEGFNMGLIPCGGGEVIWFIQINKNKLTVPLNNPAALREFSTEITLNLPYDFRCAIEISDFEKAYLWKIIDMNLLPNFYKNGIMLIGDAAHPLIPFTSQGLSCALEDAYHLATLLKNKNINSDSDLSKIYEKFYELRKEPIQQVINAGRTLLDQFLRPKKYSGIDLPYVDYEIK